MAMELARNLQAGLLRANAYHETGSRYVCALQQKIVKEAQIFYPSEGRKHVTTADNPL
jgi:hypothetical protein